MASEIQSDRARKAQELKDLQETYAKARKKAQASGQEELEQVRAENHEAIEKERETGSATVNHINRKANQEIQDAKMKGEERLTYEKEDQARKFRTTREKGRNDLADMHTSIDEQKQALGRTEDQIRKKVAQMERTESEATRDITKTEMTRRRKVIEGSQEEIRNIQNKSLADKEKVRQSQVTELRNMIEKHREQTEFIKKQQAELIAKQKTFIGSQLQDREKSDSQRLENQRKQAVERENTLRTTARKQYEQESAEAQGRINHLKEANREALLHERDKGHEGVEKTRVEYTKQIQNLEKDGDKEVATKVTTHNEILKKEDLTFRKQMDEKQATHRTSTEELAKTHRGELENAKNEYRKTLTQQKAEFDQAFQVNGKVFEDSIQDQHDRLTVELAKDKMKVTEDIGRYANMKDDPFYRLTQAEAALADDGHQYVLTATVPEHEKDNLKVFVNGKNLIVQGQRKFEDRVETEGKKVKTSNFQTYREEIPLAEPVQEKYVTRIWENGQLRVKIPKA